LVHQVGLSSHEDFIGVKGTPKAVKLLHGR
jgi:hypothetical protein